LHMEKFWGWNASPSLDWQSLPPEDREAARAIYEETEAERQARLDSLPPLTPEQAAQAAPRALLMPAQTADEARRSAIERMEWDELLRTPTVHFRCAVRMGLTHAGVIDFALRNCRPGNWDALYWYGNWVAAVGTQGQTREAIEEELQARHAQLAKAQRVEIAAKGGKAKGDKSAAAQAWTRDQWAAEGAKWDSKKQFAEAFAEVVLNQFGVKVSASTISDVWLAPSRLSKQPGEPT
jgi:hypothetical protein